MSDLVIREVTQNVWIFSRPFKILGLFPVGGRSTAIKLQSEAVWVFVSTPLSDETRNTLETLGEVKYLVAPNAFHWLFLASYKEAYPNAKVIGPESLQQKISFTLDGVYSAADPCVKHGFEDEIEAVYFTGYANKDIAFFHKASKTVIGADLLFNLPPTEQYSKTNESPKSMLLSGMNPTGRTLRVFLGGKQENKEELSRNARAVHSWDFDRYIPCHGDVIETGGKKAWESAWAKWLA